MAPRISFRRRSFWRRRPRTAAAFVTAGLLAVAGASGWLTGATRPATAPRAVKLTSAPMVTRVSLREPPAPAELQAELDKLAERFREPVGIAVTDVRAGWTAQVAGKDVFPQESVSKLWVALSTLSAVDHGRISLDQPVTLTEDDRSVFYQPVTARIRRNKPYQTTVYDLLKRQLTESDNAANDKLIAELGGGTVVTRTLASKGLDGLGVGETERDLQTRAAGLTWRPELGVTWIWKQAREELPDAVRDQALAQYLANPPDGAKPASITRALAALKRGELLSPASTETMLDLMGECRTGATRLRAGLPPGWEIAHKTGTGPDWRGASVGINDVGLLTAPDGRTYAVAVMMRQTKQPVPVRLRLMQGVSRAVAAWWRRDQSRFGSNVRIASVAAPSETAR